MKFRYLQLYQKKLFLREINNAKRPKKKSQVHGRYYSFIPFEIKKIAYENFDKYCSNLK